MHITDKILIELNYKKAYKGRFYCRSEIRFL